MNEELIKQALEIKNRILKDEFYDICGNKGGGALSLYYKYNTDNTILFTTHFYSLLHDIGIFDMDDFSRLNYAILWLQRDFTDSDGDKHYVLGLYNRKPFLNNRKDQHDNYCAIACSGVLVPEGHKSRTLFAKHIDSYGKITKKCTLGLLPSYDNRAPYKFSINPFWKPLLSGKIREAFNYFECVRQGFDVFMYKVCADRWPFGLTGINYLWFVGKTLMLGPKKETSGKLLDYLRFKALKHKWYIKPWYLLWNKRINKMYENGIADCFKMYHGANSDLYKLAMIAKEK